MWRKGSQTVNWPCGLVAPSERHRWLFANPKTGKPYLADQIQKKQLKKAALRPGVDGTVGWHSFRHSYGSWLDETGAPLGVQRELMRHADIATTMNVYGKAMATSKSEANSKVVATVFPKQMATGVFGSLAVSAESA
jgi:integrase